MERTAIAAALAALLAIGEVAAEDALDALSVGDVKLDPRGRKILICGETFLPDGLVLLVSFGFSGQIGAVRRCTVVEQRYHASIKLDRPLLPGMYVIWTEYRLVDQPEGTPEEVLPRQAVLPAVRDVRLGEEEEEREACDEARKYLLGTLERLERLQQELGRQARAAVARRQDVDSERVLEEVDRYHREAWTEEFASVCEDLRAYAESAQWRFFAEAEADLGMFVDLLQEWSEAALKKALGAPVGGGSGAGSGQEPEVATEEQPWDLEPELAATAARVRERLAVESESK